MKRRPEEELMDDREQALAYAAADFSEPHEAFVSHFRTRFPSFSRGRILDLGCGTADVIMRFLRQYPGVSIIGLDGSQAMLDIALQVSAVQGLNSRLTLRKCYLPCEDLASTHYDAVLSNSLLHHLRDPLVLWKTVTTCLNPGGIIFVMDLVRPESEESARQILERYAADESELLRRDFYNSLLAAYNEDEMREQLMSSGLEYLTVETVSDRHIIAWGIVQ